MPRPFHRRGETNDTLVQRAARVGGEGQQRPQNKKNAKMTIRKGCHFVDTIKQHKQALSLPVLFTAGRYDEATPNTTEYYRSLVSGARLRIFENSAHLTMQDEPDAYVEAVREFLHEVESR